MKIEDDASVLRPISRRERQLDSVVTTAAEASLWFVGAGWISIAIVAFICICAVDRGAVQWWLALLIFAAVWAGWLLVLRILETVFDFLERCSPRYGREVIFSQRIDELGGESVWIGIPPSTIQWIDLSDAKIDDAQLISIAEDCAFLEGLMWVQAPFSRFSPTTISRVKQKVRLFDSDSPH